MFKPIQTFRDKLDAGQPVVGAAVTFADPLVSEALADAVDFLWLDLEHVALSPSALNNHLLAARSKSKPTLVRVADVTESTLKPILDAGASGIIAAQVRSVEEVKQLINNCIYPPDGQRGAGPRVPTNYGREGGAEYIQLANDSIFISAMIETAEALEVIDRIVKIPRLDSITIGPYDLSGALGMLGQVKHSTVQQAIDRIILAAREANVHVGMGMPADSSYARQMFDRGVQWVQFGGDYEYMIAYLDQRVDEIRSS